MKMSEAYLNQQTFTQMALFALCQPWLTVETTQCSQSLILLSLFTAETKAAVEYLATVCNIPLVVLGKQ